MYLYKNVLQSHVLVTDTTLASDDLLRFRKDLLKIKGKNKQKKQNK